MKGVKIDPQKFVKKVTTIQDKPIEAPVLIFSVLKLA